MKQIFETAYGDIFWADPNEIEVLVSLSKVQKGGIATIHGYKPKTGYVTEHIADYQVITAFNTARLYERKIEALQGISFSDIPLVEGFTEELFRERIKMQIDSMSRTLEGDRSGAHREAHDRNYIRINDTIKINLVTEKRDGKQMPISHNGFPVLESIQLPVLIIKQTVIKQGDKKVVKSGLPVQMTNAIESLLNKRSVGYRTPSLRTDNFDKLSISGILVETVDIPRDLIS